MALKTIIVKPAAGPETLSCDSLHKETSSPPIMPAFKPEKSGAPDAMAIPRHKGRATRNTTKPADISVFI